MRQLQERKTICTMRYASALTTLGQKAYKFLWFRGIIDLRQRFTAKYSCKQPKTGKYDVISFHSSPWLSLFYLRKQPNVMSKPQSDDPHMFHFIIPFRNPGD